MSKENPIIYCPGCGGIITNRDGNTPASEHLDKGLYNWCEETQAMFFVQRLSDITEQDLIASARSGSPTH